MRVLRHPAIRKVRDREVASTSTHGVCASRNPFHRRTRAVSPTALFGAFSAENRGAANRFNDR
jgi:hypothetical protein